jgi:hypothetical protein
MRAHGSSHANMSAAPRKRGRPTNTAGFPFAFCGKAVRNDATSDGAAMELHVHVPGSRTIGEIIIARYCPSFWRHFVRQDASKSEWPGL